MKDRRGWAGRVAEVVGSVRRLQVHTETLTLLASVVLTLAANGSLWHRLGELRDLGNPRGWFLVICLGVLITGLQWLLLLVLCNRWTVKPVLVLLLTLTPMAVYFMARYQVHFDGAMMRNVVQTDIKEVRDLLHPMLFVYLAAGLAASWLLCQVAIMRTKWRQAAAWRSVAVLASLGMVGLSILPVMREVVPLLREHRELRYLVTPSNYIISTIGVLAKDLRASSANRPRELLDPNPRQDARVRARQPVVVVIVVGESVRAANWGLNGYARQTTPRLAARQDVINFTDVTSSGTDTATALPAMFSARARHPYDRNRIMREESLLQLVHRAGVTTLWRDNQSGDKGVSAGLPYEDMQKSGSSSFRNGDRLFDEVLLEGLDEKIAATAGDALIVLHMMGNHGPRYFERYPEQFRKWTPTCDDPDVAACPQADLTNTYDNAILYTDYVLDKAIERLASLTSHDAALIYVSDHGESLGENGLYLHGMPYFMAPDTQKKVPMIFWLSPGFAASADIDLARLRDRANQPAAHDHLYHTVLSMLDVRTTAYDPRWDLLAGCRHR